MKKQGRIMMTGHSGNEKEVGGQRNKTARDAAANQGTITDPRMCVVYFTPLGCSSDIGLSALTHHRPLRCVYLRRQRPSRRLRNAAPWNVRRI